MFLSTSTYKSGEREQEPHNLFVDFFEDCLFSGTDRSCSKLNIELPYPIHDPFEHYCADTKDSLNELLSKKKEYDEKLKTMRTTYPLKSIKEIKLKETQSQYAYLPRGLLAVYNFKDPDKDFNSDYNIYYTGGILDEININNQRYLIRTTYDKSLSLLNMENLSENTNLPFKTESSVYCLRCFKLNKKWVVLLREKFTVTLIEVVDLKKCVILYSHSFENPVCDARINTNNNIDLGIIELNKALVVRHMKSDRILFRYESKLKKFVSGFQQFEFLDKAKIILLDDFFVKVIDYHSNIELKCFNPKLISCNTLCNFKIIGDILYLASRHYLIKTNLKSLDKFSIFSHTLENAPLFMDVIESDANTFLCLANHFQDDKILFTGKSLFSIPYKVPGIKSTLIEARLRNPDLVLVDQLDKRLGFSIAGLKLAQVNNTMFLYFVNSLGEIFTQKISDDSPTDKPINSLTNWLGKLNLKEPILYITNFAEMSDFFFFLNKHDNNDIVENKKINMNTEKFLTKYRQVYNKKHITSTLAKSFLEIWDKDEESEVEDIVPEVPEVPFYDKVNSWMKNLNGELISGSVEDKI